MEDTAQRVGGRAAQLIRRRGGDREADDLAREREPVVRAALRGERGEGGEDEASASGRCTSPPEPENKSRSFGVDT